MTTPSWNSCTARNFDSIYRLICHSLLAGDQVDNTRELRNVEFTIEDIDDVFSSCRNPSLSYMLAELVWHFSGSRNTAWISNYASYWKKISDNGITANSAYGYLIKRRYSFDQISKVIELLRKYPSSRRGVINLNFANPAILITKDEICTIALQYYIRDGKLYCTGMMRSNDVWTGLPYDIVYFTAIQKIIAKALGIEAGSYTHFAVSLHVYEKDIEKIKRCLEPKGHIKEFSIDVVKLEENARYLYQAATKENIIDLAKSRGIIKGELE